ncbi:hypothetical protein B0H17DRAFT_1215120 [Mycena rosella]|uniref:Uncharacterized protein n=1 Tax=Mycena rosella TaxID=1033263 RepID=A0AAD7G033_MYCRO|nr:hypothetical protein B0H17DRAFT_1215120 [Mycena rosella]
MLRAPAYLHSTGYVRLELRRESGEVEVKKSDARSDEFIVDLIDDPTEGDEYEPDPKPTIKRQQKQTGLIEVEDSDPESDTDALLHEIKAAEAKEREVKAKLKAKLEVVADAEIEENICYIARWRTLNEPLSAQCELFVNRNGTDTRALVSCMEKAKKQTQKQTSKNKLVHQFTQFSILRAPCEDDPPGYVRLELRRFRGEVEVEKSDARSYEF